MTDAKKIIKNILGGGLEAVKEIKKAVGPGALIEAAIGGGKPDEYSEYLKTIGNPNLTGEKLEEKKIETAQKDGREMSKLRTFLQATAPHMRLPEKPPELRPAEKIEQEKQQQREAMAEQNAKGPKVITSPAAKPQQGGRPGGRRKVSKGFEGLQKDAKVG